MLVAGLLKTGIICAKIIGGFNSGIKHGCQKDFKAFEVVGNAPVREPKQPRRAHGVDEREPKDAL